VATTAMAATAGSARCSGRSPITTCTAYAMWGYGDDPPRFWDYGYNDIYAGMFRSLRVYDDLAGYLPPGIGGKSCSARGRRSRAFASTNPAPDQLTQMCGDDSRDIAGLPDRSDPAGYFSPTKPSARAARRSRQRLGEGGPGQSKPRVPPSYR